MTTLHEINARSRELKIDSELPATLLIIGNGRFNQVSVQTPPVHSPPQAILFSVKLVA
jgi:hypothetical protein